MQLGPMQLDGILAGMIFSGVLAESPLSRHEPEVLRKVTCGNAARVDGFPV